MADLHGTTASSATANGARYKFVLFLSPFLYLVALFTFPPPLALFRDYAYNRKLKNQRTNERTNVSCGQFAWVRVMML